MILRAWASLKKRRQLGQDADFDELGTWIENNVYGSSMGFVRLSVLWEDLLSNIPGITSGHASAGTTGTPTARRQSASLTSLPTYATSLSATPSRSVRSRSTASLSSTPCKQSARSLRAL